MLTPSASGAIMLSPRPALLTVPSYHPPLAGREGLRLDFNENTVGCSARVLERLRDLSFEDLARYPERCPVEAELAGFLQISPAELVLTNGVDEAIHLLCQAYLDPGDQALIVVPTYSMYRIYMLAAGANVVSVPAGPNFEFPLEEVLTSITTRTRLIAIANPNNPTGTVVSRASLAQIARAAPNAALLVDEAYFEFYGQTLLPDRGSLPNLFVARTFSKAYGMAGLRVGVLVGDPDQMRSVLQVCSPYNVNAIALACLPVALADQGYIQQYVREVKEARRLLERALGEASIAYWPSQANFILVRIGSPEAAASFVEQMRDRGILVRDRSNDPGCAGCVRITLGPHEPTVRLLAALKATLPQIVSPEGVSRR
jgi:histidinol-phosphate aminotransferase